MVDAASRIIIIAVFAVILVLTIGVGITLAIWRKNSRKQMCDIASHNESRIAAMERTGVHSKLTITGARSGSNAVRTWRHVQSDETISANSNATFRNNNTPNTAIVVDKPTAAAMLGSAYSGGSNAHDFVWPFLQHSLADSGISDYSESGRSTATSVFVEPFEFVTEQRESSTRGIAAFIPRKAVIH
ncbi:hypothetical protein HK100_008442 [Physocladia obscura]|uniref:Uncharacterized protein n=1 Tax=Physocladia obscura TaxID=109957 RepID=A0AAD5XFI6_9FUNG|nr:hypothetical protein HK100_008442 [Physocladia obscura]